MSKTAMLGLALVAAACMGQTAHAQQGKRPQLPIS